MNHIVFDLDGTLIDSAPDIHTSTNLLLAEHQLGTLKLSQTRSFIGNGSKKLVERAFRSFGKKQFHEEELNQLTKRFVEIYMENLVEKTTLYPNVVETLNALIQSGYDLSLCTNKPLQPTEAILEVMDLRKLFKSVVGGDSYEEKKPSPLPLQKIMEEQNISPTQTYMVGDSIHDVEAGQAAGLKTILVTYGYSRIPHKEIPATVCIDDFANLPQAIDNISL